MRFEIHPADRPYIYEGAPKQSLEAYKRHLKTAKELGYASVYAALYDMRVNKKYNLAKIQMWMHIGGGNIKKILKALNINGN